MKQVFTHSNLVFVHHIKNILENHQIACIVSGDVEAGMISGSLGSGAMVSVMDDADEEAALKLIASVLDSEENSDESWNCSRCKEPIEPQFSECWKCGKERG